MAVLLGAGRGLEGHAFRTTALGVLDDGATGAARVHLGASRTVGHAVFAMDVGVLARGHLHLVDRHGVLSVGGHVRVVVEVGGDALFLEDALGGIVSFMERAGAVEPRKLVAAEMVEGTGVQTAPVVTALLPGRAVVVAVENASKGRGTNGPVLQRIVKMGAEMRRGWEEDQRTEAVAC